MLVEKGSCVYSSLKLGRELISRWFSGDPKKFSDRDFHSLSKNEAKPS